MTEVFDAWAAERLQKPQQQFISPNAMTYPAGQLHQPPQPQQQAAYYCNNFVAELPPAPAQNFPMSPPLTPNTPSTGYPSPALPNLAPNNPYAYRPPMQGAIEMPVELPGHTMLAAPAPAPTRSISTEVHSQSPIRRMS